MIDKGTVIQIVEEFIKDSDRFIVDVEIGKDNAILVKVDSEDGVPIDYYAELSRFIESKLDREAEDYQLEVGSPGLDSPFKTVKQYYKYEGSDVEVQDLTGTKYRGTLVNVSETGFGLEVTRKEKPEGAKRKLDVTEIVPFEYENIKYTKYTIRF